jgi:hypothetical protein
VCLQVTYGRWLIEGAPRVLLFDVSSSFPRAEEWKRVSEALFSGGQRERERER